MTWETLINEEKAAPFKEKLEDIATALVANPLKESDNIGLMGGKIGIALFYFYYDRFLGEDRFADHGVDLISAVFDEINKDFTYHTHAGGLAGIGWSVEHLARQEFIDADTNDILEDLDPFLHKTMIHEIEKNRNYDYLHGAVGNGLYFLHRLANPNVRAYLEEFIGHLDRMAQRDDDGALKWLSTLDHESGKKGYNLSLSHGISSIIAFLAKALELGIEKERTATLLGGAVQYLLKYKLDRQQFKSNFPSWISDEDPPSNSRLAWCYGDLGIAIALLQAARAMQNPDWETIAVDVLLDSTARRDPEENIVRDAGLCHGAAGIMHIYNRAHQYTHRAPFKETARHWADLALKMADQTDGLAGYKTWRTEKYGGWINEPGFLEGISGIGLSYISMLSDIEPAWDRSLLIS